MAKVHYEAFMDGEDAAGKTTGDAWEKYPALSEAKKAVLEIERAYDRFMQEMYHYGIPGEIFPTLRLSAENGDPETERPQDKTFALYLEGDGEKGLVSMKIKEVSTPAHKGIFPDKLLNETIKLESYLDKCGIKYSRVYIVDESTGETIRSFAGGGPAPESMTLTEQEGLEAE